MSKSVILIPFLLLLDPVSAAPAPSAEQDLPRLRSTAILVLDNSADQVLLARSADETRAIASLTKVQVALVLRQHHLSLEHDTRITRQDHRIARRGARSRLRLNRSYRNRDLLHAMLMASDNRAVTALARSAGMSPGELVSEMNRLAQAQNLQQTSFKGPIGLNYENVATAREIASLMRHASQDAVLSSAMGRRVHRIRPLRGKGTVRFHNTNRLVGTTRDVTFLASKTGFNRAAGYCIAAVVRLQDDSEYTIVLLGAPSKRHRLNDLARTVRWLKRTARTERAVGG